MKNLTQLRYSLFGQFKRSGLFTLLAGITLLSSCKEDEDYHPIALKHKIQVNGTLLNVKESGAGKTTVVFISGLGEPLATWQEVQPMVARFSSTFAYDRAGIGQSGPVTGSRTSQDVAQELHQLLMEAKVKTPIVLVAHSVGGLHARQYAHLYPQEVAGVVLLDPTMEEELLPLKNGNLPGGLTGEAFLSQIAEEQGMTGGMKAEFISSLQSAEQVENAIFPQVPLTIITPMNPEPGEAPGTREMKQILHGQFVSGVADGVHTLARNSGHHIQKDKPELVEESIRQLIQKIK